MEKQADCAYLLGSIRCVLAMLKFLFGIALGRMRVCHHKDAMTALERLHADKNHGNGTKVRCRCEES